MEYNSVVTILQQGANAWVSAKNLSLNQLRILAREAARKDVMLTVECRNGIFTDNELKLLAQEGGKNITIVG